MVCLAFSSSSLNFSASANILSISSLERRPLSFVTVILSDLPLDFSLAVTFKIPFASKS